MIKSTPTSGGKETSLVLSAVANEGEGAIALTDEATVKNQIVVSTFRAISPDDKMPDKADCRDQSISLSGSSVDAKDEGDRRTYMARNQIMGTRYYTLWWKNQDFLDFHAFFL